MFCQKCRAPLKLDSSLDDLNPAAFDLLISATGKSGPQQSSVTTSPQPHYPPERKELYDQTRQHASSAPIFKRTIPAPRHAAQQHLVPGAPSPNPASRENPAMSFVMLTDSQVVAPPPTPPTKASRRRQSSSPSKPPINSLEASLSAQIETTSRLFSLLSSRTDIDHPICTECTSLLLSAFTQRLAQTTAERSTYSQFLKSLSASAPTPEEISATEQSLEEATAAEASALSTLEALEAQHSQVLSEIANLEDEARQLDDEEKNFWRERNAFALTLTEFQNERDGVNLAFDHDSRQLERLQRTNVYNDTFCIGHDGFFGTINGLRLGRLPNQPVEWAEINAAWGQTLLLLATVAEKLNFHFDGYRLKPMGSTSKIEKLEYPPTSSSTTTSPASSTTSHPPPQNPPAPTPPSAPPKITVLELYSQPDLPLPINLNFLHRRFDTAMVAFLACLQQLGTHLENMPARATAGAHAQPAQGLRLPYEIKKDKINGESIRLGGGFGGGRDEGWTRACKYGLTCCKFLLAGASNLSAGAQHASGR